MRSKYQSQTVKKGNGQTHNKAVKNVLEYLYKHYEEQYDIYEEWYLQFSARFNKENKLRVDYGHAYDIVLVSLELPHRDYFIEVDGEKHSKTNQKINDGIAEKFLKEVLKVPILRLDKTECLGDKTDRERYFKDNIGPFLK